jgi:hypothetical protein
MSKYIYFTIALSASLIFTISCGQGGANTAANNGNTMLLQRFSGNFEVTNVDCSSLDASGLPTQGSVIIHIYQSNPPVAAYGSPQTCSNLNSSAISIGQTEEIGVISYTQNSAGIQDLCDYHIVPNDTIDSTLYTFTFATNPTLSTIQVSCQQADSACVCHQSGNF